jgi:plastocyanin
MSQVQPSKAPSGSRTALAVAIVALILGAGGLGYAVYLGLSQVPSQFSSFPVVNESVANRSITIEWVSKFDSGKDRFVPGFITIAQGDTVTLTFISNDTGDAHTFTLTLPTSVPGFFQLNNSAAGLTNFLTKAKFTGPAGGCTDQNARTVACKTTGTIGNLTATGSFTVKVAGIYRFKCIYHEKLGMFGWLIVLANKGFTG